MTHVVIIGGGAAGVLAAVALTGKPGVDTTLIERSPRAGPGLAYGAARDFHLLNSRAGTMGIAEPGDFVSWCTEQSHPVEASGFVPRRLYGEYLVDSLARSSADVAHGTAVAVDTGADRRLGVRFDDGSRIEADHVVLAVGNPPPAGRGVDPWSLTASDVGERARVQLIGTGLTMVDTAIALARDHPLARITATSRSMLLPRVHLPVPDSVGPGLSPEPSGATVDRLVTAFQDRLRRRERSWQGEVDGIRPQVNRLWSMLPAAEQQRFALHFSRRWEVLRHRMAPSIAAELDDLRRSGRVVLAPEPRPADVVVDCTGPRSVASRGWNPIIDSLLDRGLIRANALGLGVAVDASGRAVGDDRSVPARVTVLGPGRRGDEWECTAIPEIRAQARAFAERIGG